MEEQEHVVDECACCHGPFHPKSGMWVGWPKKFPFCSRCWRESFQAFKVARSWKGKKKWQHLVFGPDIPSAETF